MMRKRGYFFSIIERQSERSFREIPIWRRETGTDCSKLKGKLIRRPLKRRYGIKF